MTSGGSNVRVRVGVFGTVNVVIGVVFFVAFSAIVAFTAASIASGTNVVWSAVGGCPRANGCTGDGFARGEWRQYLARRGGPH